MKLKNYKYYLIFIFSFSSVLFAQSQFELNGYLQNMQTVWQPKQSSKLQFQNSIVNRFNLMYFASDEIKISIGLRNIFDYGEFVSLIPNYENFAARDSGYLNLTKVISSGNSTLLYSNIDRLNLLFTKNNFEVQIGRQRVNLGISMVWTPNDIFNSSSFLNFDYIEKPGSDAIRFQYYTGIASSVQLVYKLSGKKKTTAAVIVKLNNWDYDFQLLSGIMEDDLVFGGAWSGQISDAGFTGEFSYFRNKNDFQNSKGILLASIGGNYIFSNGLMLQTEFLYNSNGKTGETFIPNNLFTMEYSAKNLSPSKYSLFAQLSYPLTPLTKSSLATIFNPSDNSFFLNPSLELSLNQDVYLLLSAQIFVGKDFTEWGDYGKFYYLRLKWNF